VLRSLYSLSLLGLLLAASPAVAQEIHIAPHCRVKNRPPGRCGWCALETLARHHGLKAIYGLADRHACTCSPRSLEEALQETGVHYRMQYPGCRSRSILHYAIEEELGAAIGLRVGSSSGSSDAFGQSHSAHGAAAGHIVILVALSLDAVKFIDPNDAEGHTRTMSLRRFLALWDGLAVVLVPEGKWVWREPYPRRKRETTAAIRQTDSSMSCRDNSGLRLKRIAERSTASSTPIACRTGEGKSEPLEQAEPVEQATPARSRFISSKSAFRPGKDTLMVCGRPSSGPFRTMGAAWVRS
jgi:hypothetical protein